MKQIFSKKSRLLIVVAVGLLLASCIDGFNSDWTFSSGVTNTTLVSPDSTKVTFSKDINGNLVVKWPVVYGAGGYQFSLFIVDDPAHPVAVGDSSQVVDGCSATRPLQEDTKYKVVIKALGNTKYNNKTALKPSNVLYNTLLPAYAIIPDGTDLYTYFTNNAVPDSTHELAYELVPNGQYTLSGPVDFQKHWITLRGDKVHHPTLTYGISGRLRTTAGFTLKYLDVDGKNVGPDVTDNAVLLMSSTPDPAIYSSTNQYYIISKDIFFLKCNFINVNRRLISDAGVKYCIANLVISDCKIALNALNDGTGGVIYLYTGFANNFTIKNSTVWGNTKVGGYFLRYSNAGRPDRAGFVSGSINFFNNTFYNVAYSNQMANYSGMGSASTSSGSTVYLRVSQNIFVDCGSQNVIRRLSAGTNTMVKTLKDNCYWYDGAFPQVGEIDNANGDKSGTGYGQSPDFSSASTGDFTIGPNATTIISKKGGDPRWLPATK